MEKKSITLFCSRNVAVFFFFFGGGGGGGAILTLFGKACGARGPGFDSRSRRHDFRDYNGKRIKSYYQTESDGNTNEHRTK